MDKIIRIRLYLQEMQVLVRYASGSIAWFPACSLPNSIKDQLLKTDKIMIEGLTWVFLFGDN